MCVYVGILSVYGVVICHILICTVVVSFSLSLSLSLSPYMRSMNEVETLYHSCSEFSEVVRPIRRQPETPAGTTLAVRGQLACGGRGSKIKFVTGGGGEKIVCCWGGGGGRELLCCGKGEELFIVVGEGVGLSDSVVMLD